MFHRTNAHRPSPRSADRFRLFCVLPKTSQLVLTSKEFPSFFFIAVSQFTSTCLVVSLLRLTGHIKVGHGCRIVVQQESARPVPHAIYHTSRTQFQCDICRQTLLDVYRRCWTYFVEAAVVGVCRTPWLALFCCLLRVSCLKNTSLSLPPCLPDPLILHQTSWLGLTERPRRLSRPSCFIFFSTPCPAWAARSASAYR